MDYSFGYTHMIWLHFDAINYGPAYTHLLEIDEPMTSTV